MASYPKTSCKLEAETLLGRAVSCEGEKSYGFPTRFKNVSTLEDAIHAADLLREKWHCGDGPIASILRLLERKKDHDTSCC